MIRKPSVPVVEKKSESKTSRSPLFQNPSKKV
jgi:hypothetical protein